MSRTLLSLSVCLVLIATVSHAQDKTKKVTIEAVELNVARKADDKKFTFTGNRTSVNLMVAYPGKQLLGIDDSSKLTSFSDDKGTSLLGNEKEFFKTKFSAFPQIAKDRSALIVGLSNYTKAPAKGATKLIIKGELVLLCGLAEKESDAKEIEFADMAKEKLGDFDLTVTRAKGFGGGPDLQISGKTRGIKSLIVKGDDGKAVAVMPSGSSGFGNQWTYYYSVSKPLKKAKISVSYYSKVEKVAVPVNQSVSVGLGD